MIRPRPATSPGESASGTGSGRVLPRTSGPAGAPPTPVPGSPGVLADVGRSATVDVAVNVDAVTKYFYKGSVRFTALAATSLAIRRNEFVALLGPSGCGKSTLLNLIAGIERPDAGTIIHEGRPLAGMAVGTGYLTQHDTLLPWRTVHDNIALPLRIAKTYAAEQDRVLWAISLVGLDGFARHYPSELSGGMRKRVALAQNLVYARRLLLMDEPFGALDAQTRTMLQSELLEIWRSEPRTIVFVTHDIEEAILLADRVVVMGTRPGHVSTVLDIDIPRPRDVASVRFTERFGELYRTIWEHVFALQVSAGPNPFGDEEPRGRRGFGRRRGAAPSPLGGSPASTRSPGPSSDHTPAGPASSPGSHTSVRAVSSVGARLGSTGECASPDRTVPVR